MDADKTEAAKAALILLNKCRLSVLLSIPVYASIHIYNAIIITTAQNVMHTGTHLIKKLISVSPDLYHCV